MKYGDQNLPKTKNSRVTIALHVLIWIVVFLIPYIFSADVALGDHIKNKDQNDFLYLNTALDVFWVILFYFNASFLIPRLIYTRKIFWYILSIIGILGVVIVIDKSLFIMLEMSRRFSLYHSVQHNLIPFLFTVAVSGAYKALADKSNADLLIREQQSEHLKTELSFLRSQISPHFLFNVLNNITALVRMKSAELEPTILKLSTLMQYMLYETDDEKVIIKSEVEYLQAYIDLQRQRFGEELILTATFDVKEDCHGIEPMLLIPFIENAFKHGGIIKNSEIHTSLSVAGNMLHFIVKNKFYTRPFIKDKTSGIGLANVKRRLELLYPGKHQLIIDQQGDWYIIDLTINLPS